MAIIRPFKGFLYNPERINVDDVMCPPYDIISDTLREIFYSKSSYNIVRIDYGKNSPEMDKYTSARQYLDRWIDEGILVQEKEPCFYGYEIQYSYKNKKKTLRGLIATVRLEELGKGIYPHEQTYSKPKTDRLMLMKACMANTSLIFSIYRSKERVTSRILEELKNPYLTAKDMDGNIHKLYKIHDSNKINKIVEELKNYPVFIADGHHRYEVALEFKKQMEKMHLEKKEDAAWNYVMMFLANTEDEGFLILPTHRLLNTPLPIKKEFEKYSHVFSLKEFNKNEDINEAIEKMGSKNIGLYLKENKWYIIQYNSSFFEYILDELKDVDVKILEDVILNKIFPEKEVQYEIEMERGIKLVNECKYDAIFILRATKVEEIERVALAGLRMPPKSTYFYPKLLTGMVIYVF